ncbi:Putative sterigmatocystin biosynthesis peroxidase stcC [Psilocybe cubensis]|uniref:Sterigmatocystin biosynthesis peroxidase stcC n=2 Tax=Psilocybe cubensis TaxID=181762 RepID=A0ACB8H5V3_PSICU|nr:Putative sterigmatocystin biosynthesis peroxidase stcC [Psilocybe cubensis]KAH9483276.1 Putative sterigmatocystin biosynthesis peroxidase stcC [Psilocybe cubensis]
MTSRHQACPATGQTYEFCPAQEGDSRSPCPALNAMANHGYISRDGKNIGPQDLVRGLKACYGLSNPLAYLLAYVGFAIIFRKFGRISLFELGRHGRIEHDASLVHHDTPAGLEYAPIEVDQGLVNALVADVRPGAKEVEARGEEFLMGVEDVARARVRREAECRPIGSVSAEIARGEMALVLGIWEKSTGIKTGVPVEYIRRWISEERLPEGWKPDHVQTLLGVVKLARSLKAATDKLRKEESIAKAKES